MKVTFGENFTRYYFNFPKSDQAKIREFITHVETYGLTQLKGRNKSSDNVPTNDPNWTNKVAYAQKHKLWHFHIGIPDYTLSEKGDYVSEYILHYQLFDDEIKLVSMSYHPPFELPTPHELK